MLKKSSYLLILIFGIIGSSLYSESFWEQKTSLFWEICTYGTQGHLCTEGKSEEKTWEEAVRICAEKKDRGIRWRLPEKEELQAVVKKQNTTPYIDLELFPGTLPKNYWANLDDSGRYPYINFFKGDFGTYASSTKKANFRCVADSVHKVTHLDVSSFSDLKAILPLNWYLSFKDSKIIIERGEKVWKYSENKLNAPKEERKEEQKLKWIKKNGILVLPRLVLRVEKRIEGKEEASVPAKRKEKTKNQSSVHLPDYSWKGYQFYLIEKQGISDEYDSIYPEEADREINYILQGLEQFRVHPINPNFP